MIRFLYSAIFTLLSWFIPLVALFNPKVNNGYLGRKRQKLPHLDRAPIWIHCASLGEFEQGRPVIESLKKQWPDVPIVLTFFSSSGYEVRKQYNQVEWVGYIPFDLPGNAERFISAIKPQLAIFVKYEYWFNHLLVLGKYKIPYLFISNVWRSHYFPLKWWAPWFLHVIKKGAAFFVQDQISFDILTARNFERVFLVGDTRIDRVMELLNQPKKSEQLARWCNEAPVLIAGSTWAEDEHLIYRFFSETPSIRLILAPHEPSKKRLEEVNTLFERFQPCLYSQWKGEPVTVLILDSVGLLNSLYGYGSAAYIGGGFDKGIHNTLEAAVYGIPVFFGPKNKNFKEAQDLLAQDLAFEVHTSTDFIQRWSEVFPGQLPRIKEQLESYFIQNQGATAKIIDYLRGFIQA